MSIPIFSTCILFVFAVGIGGCAPSSDSDTSYLDGDFSNNAYVDTATVVEDASTKIAYKEMYGNTITIPVKINGLWLDMIYDTGASSTCITLAEAKYLYEKGQLLTDDIIDVQQFQTADGNISAGLRINLRDISIGDNINLHNIEALVVENQRAPLLLGQSVMKKFREISVDRQNGVIKFFE